MKLGDKVIVSAIIEKDKRYDNMITITDYKSIPIEPRVGIYLGYRHLQKGTTVYDRDDGPQFRGKGTQKVLLVAVHELQNMLHADPNFTV